MSEERKAFEEVKNELIKTVGFHELAKMEVAAEKIIEPIRNLGDAGQVFLYYLAIKIAAEYAED